MSKKFSNDGIHLCFAGHIDVVPPGEGWRSDPFVPAIEDGFLYGRGASDMKSGLAAFINAIKQVDKFHGTLSTIITSDEEGDAYFGTLEVLKQLKIKDMLPDVCVVAEPTCDKVFGDTIKVGRRGSINGKITIIGRGGHAAYPQKAVNPITLASGFLVAISDKKLDNGDEFFAPSQLVVTDIRSGYGKTNVIPTELTLMFNVRNSTATTVMDVENFIKSTAKVCGIEEYKLEINQSSNSFVAQKTDLSNRLITALSKSVEECTNILPALSTSGGTSDARFIAEFGVAVVEFGPTNETIHAPNERVSIDDIVKLEKIFQDFIEKL